MNKDTYFNFDEIIKIFDNCSQLDKIIMSAEDSINPTSLAYFDVMTGIVYTVFSDEKKIQVESFSKISGKFDELGYVLKIVRGLVQKSQEFDDNCLKADEYIESIINPKPPKPLKKYSC